MVLHFVSYVDVVKKFPIIFSFSVPSSWKFGGFCRSFGGDNFCKIHLCMTSKKIWAILGFNFLFSSSLGFGFFPYKLADLVGEKSMNLPRVSSNVLQL
jgi:hypothetical protein